MRILFISYKSFFDKIVKKNLEVICKYIEFYSILTDFIIFSPIQYFHVWQYRSILCLDVLL